MIKNSRLLLLRSCYFLVSILTTVTKGNKRLVSLKLSIGILLLTTGNTAFAQTVNTTTSPVKKITVAKDTFTVNIVMEPEEVQYEKIIVTCYYAGPVKTITGSISSIGNEDLMVSTNNNLKELQTIDSTNITAPINKSPIIEEPVWSINGEKLIDFLDSNLIYPSKAKKKGISGNVTILFTVDKKGKTKNAIVLKGLGFGCDKEALRLVELLHFDLPGKKTGKTTDFQQTITIEFKLPEE